MNLALSLPYAGAGLGALLTIGIAIQARGYVARWALVIGVALLSLESVLIGESVNHQQLERLIYWQYWRMLAISFLPGVWLVFSLTYARGNARDFLAKWKWALAAAFVVPPILPLLFRQGLFVLWTQGPSENRLLLQLGWAGLALHLLLTIASVLVLMNLERTLRASVGTMRWRIKFMLLGVTVLFIVRIYTSSQTLLFRTVDLPLDSINAVALVVAAILIVRSLFRVGHFDLDVYPSESILQGSVAVLLAGIYLFSVGVFAKVVMYLGGDDAFALKAFIVLAALVLLSILWQSDRLRLQLRRFVSRHFQRPFYDYRTVWKKFSEETASQIDRVEFNRTLVRLMADIFQALAVSIWLVDDKRESFVLVASTSISDVQGLSLRPAAADAGPVLAQLKSNGEPVDIESLNTSWASSLRKLHPTEFPNGGNRVCVPIVGRGETLGFIMLGDRVSGAVFSVQDFDMLKCIGDHAAAGLLNVQLSQRLVQAKELEAFQTMGTFFVHDLKNAASTLNLMLQNLPVHFDDPEFREDALRGVSKVVTHINHMVGRLSSLRHEFKVNLVNRDLNAVIEDTLRDIDLGTSYTLVKRLGSLPMISIDAEQIDKVITNLVLNAREAMARPGEITVATALTGSWVVLSVTDTGSGMTPEFIERSLFRPFQTTKKNGLGIGMFQSKMIVESHGGRISVASQSGHGTTMQVFFPLPKSSQ